MNFTKRHWGIKTLLAALAFLGLQCCSPLTIKTPAPALDSIRVQTILSDFEGQERAAKSLFFSGTLTLLNGDSENSAQILVIAEPAAPVPPQTEPAYAHGRIKIEITHPWGKPLLHLYLEGERLFIIDFTEKQFLKGSLRSRYLASRIPIPFNQAVWWSFVRCFPVVLDFDKAVSTTGGRITLLDSKGDDIQTFALYSAEPLPRRTFFLKQNVEMDFSDFEDDQGVLYARRVTLHQPEHEIVLSIKIDRMTINRPIPKAVFEMIPPRGFKTFLLKDEDS